MIMENGSLHMCEESVEALRTILYTYGDSTLSDVRYFLGVTDDLLANMNFERVLLHQTINSQTLCIVASLLINDEQTQAKAMRKLMNSLLSDYGVSSAWVQSLLEGLSLATGAPAPAIPDEYGKSTLEPHSVTYVTRTAEWVDATKLVPDYKIFVDASFLMSDGASDFIESLYPVLQQEQNKLIIPIVTVDKVRAASWEEETTAEGIRAARIIRHLQNARLADFRSGPEDDNESNVFERVFKAFCNRYNLCLLSENVEITARIEKVCKVQNKQSSHSILIASLVSEGGRYLLRSHTKS